MSVLKLILLFRDHAHRDAELVITVRKGSVRIDAHKKVRNGRDKQLTCSQSGGTSFSDWGPDRLAQEVIEELAENAVRKAIELET
jgi:hypothetical protein